MTTSIISHEDYFGIWYGHPDETTEVRLKVADLLPKVNDLLQLAVNDGIPLAINPKTQSYVSGETYGGFRPQDCPIGAPQSAHKLGMAVDIYDPENEIDEWCMRHQDILKRLGLCMESPEATPRWCHLSTKMPKSGKTVFHP